MKSKDDENKIRDEWKLRYFNDIEQRDKELTSLREQLNESEENANIYAIEAEEMRKENKKLLAELNNAPKIVHMAEKEVEKEKPDYLEQLRAAQANLLEHNEKINQLLENIDALKETEEKQRVIMRKNEELMEQVQDLQAKLAEKDREIAGIRQKEHLTKEMASMLDNAYNEFNVLQSKMQKLESQVSSSKMINLEYEDLKEGYRKLSRDFEEQKMKLTSLGSENQHLQAQVVELEEKLREANFHRQQMQKRVTYLEELNNDLQSVSDANKKLEVQLKRIGELESMLSMANEEKDQIQRRRADK
jgi:chromosome segregation ATPase